MLAPLSSAEAFEQNTGALTGSGTIRQSQPSGLDIDYGITGSDLSGANSGGMSGRGGAAANFINGFDLGAPTLQLSADYATTCARPARNAINYCANRGSVTVNFEHPTKDPVIHLAGLGGSASGSYRPPFSITTYYEALIYSGALKIPSGVSATVVNGTNLQVANGYIQASNARADASCSSTLTEVGNVNVNGGSTAGCGSVQLAGTFSQVTFQVDLQTTCLTSNNNQADCNDVTPGADAFLLSTTNGLDFGDAPASYNAGNAARHVPGTLALGATSPDDDGGGRNPVASPVAVASGASANGGNGDGADEDAFGVLPDIVAQGTVAYPLTVPLSGTSKAGAVSGWIDFNRNGTFDAGEKATSTYAAGATSVNLSFAKPAGLTPGLTYARFRTAFDVGDVAGANGPAASGEVEDYSVNIVTEVADVTFVKSAGAVQDTNNDGINSAGDKVTYTFTVTNSGNATVNSIAITDPKIAGVTCQATSLAVGANTTCTGTYTLTQADVAAGTVANTATVTGTSVNGTAVSKTASTNRSITQVTRGSLAKAAGTLNDIDGNGPDVGDTIPYTFTTTNTGNLPLTSVAINDAKIPGATCPAGTIAPGGTKQCTGTYTLTQADVNAGKVDNSATATVTSAAGSSTTSAATATKTFTPTKTFVFDKQASTVNDLDGNGPDVGDTITYSFVFTNTGTASLNTPSVTDNLVGAVTCPAAPIDPGASVTCTKSYTLTQANVDSGAVNNSATGVMKGPDGANLPPSAPDLTSTTVTPSNAIKVTKTAGTPNLGANGRPDPGDTIAYSFEIENTGGSTLTNPMINDPKIGAVTCAPGTLAPGQKLTCTKTYALSQADVDAGTVNNSATASASLPNASVITSAASTTTSPLQRISTVGFNKAAGSIVDANTNGKVDAGDTIQYSFTAVNTGNTTLNSIVVNDPKVGTVTCSPTTLLPGATLVCTKVYTLTLADVDSGAVNNSATVTATPQGGTAFTTGPDVTSTPITSTGSMTLSKVPGAVNDLDGNGSDVGDTVPYTFTITNTGTASISGLSVSDPKISASAIACSPTSIAPNGTSTCTATYTLTQADVNAGKVDNSATANGTKAGGGAVSANQTASKTFVPTSSFTFNKAAGLIATGPDGRADVGDTITYTFTFANSGATTLTNPAVTDAKLGPVTCPAATLTPGQSVACSKVYALTQADINSGAVNNTASGTMSPPAGLPGPPAVSDSTSRPVAPANALTLAKSAGAVATGPDGRADVGDTITYSFLVTNTGNQTLTAVAVSDPKVGPVSCGTTTLAPGQSVTCTKAYPLTQADLDLGKVDNTASASAKDAQNVTVSSNASTISTPVAAAPALVVDKQVGTYTDVNSNSRVDAGDSIVYGFVIQNTGNVTLDPVTVSDPKIGAVTCPSGPLAPNATRTCTPKLYTITQADADGGAVNNSATATGKPPVGAAITSAPDTTSTSTTDVRSLTLVKAAGAVNDLDGNGVDVGDTVPYTITATNSGTKTLTDVVVTDVKLTGLTCSPSTLAAGQVATCTGTYTLTQADVDAGSVNNTANATAKDPANGPVTATASTTKTLVAVSSFSFDKQAAAIETGPDDRADVGDTIAYTFTFTNTGRTTLKAPVVTDAKVGTVTCPTGAVAPGASVACTKVYALTQTDIDSGAVNNTATGQMTPNAVGTPNPVPATRTDSTSSSVSPASQLQLVKTAGTPVDANANNVLDAGDTIVYTFTLTNGGNTTLSGVTVSDPKIGAVNCPAGAIAPGGTKACTKTYTISQSDLDAGAITNSASASANDTLGNPVPSNTSTITSTLAAAPSASLDKQADSPSDANGSGLVDAGDTIAYTFVVENTGNVTLDPVTVSDPKAGAVTCPTGPLAPGASRSCGPVVYTITQTDADAGSVDNTATVTAKPPVGPAVTATDTTSTPTTQVSDLTVTKVPGAVNDLDGNGTDVGDTVPYAITVTNAGTRTITSIAVTDPKIAALACTPTTLAAGASATCSGTYTLTQADVDAGKVDNSATATGRDPGNVLVTSTGTSTKTLQPTSTFTFDKQAALSADANDSGRLDAGDTITYSFVFTNTGTTSLRNPQVTDAKVGPVTCPTVSVLPGAAVSCTKTYTLSQADIDGGAVNNTATGSISSPPGRPAPTPPSLTDSTSSMLTPANTLSLVKTAGAPVDANGNGRADVGETITYSFAVTNTGAQTLTLLAINDPKIGTVACPATTIAPAQTITCSKAYPLTQADIDAGGVPNSASATASAPGGGAVTSNTATITTDVTRSPAVVLDKQAGTYTDVNTNARIDAGDTIRYSFLVQNIGNTTLDQIAVDDPKIGAITCPTGGLAPGATATCTPKVYTITQNDVDAGAVANSATVTVKPAGLPAITSNPDSTSTPTTSSSTMTLTKTAGVPVDSDANGPDVGDLLPYTFTVTNTGSTTLTGVAVADPLISGLISCSTTTLTPTQSATCTGNHVLTQSEVDAGVVNNTAQASATGPGATPVTATGSTSKTIVPVSSFTFDKQAGARTDVDDDGQASAGDTLAYTFVFTNTGATTLSGPTVADPKIPGVTCLAAPVAPGAQVSCSGTYELTQADVNAGAVNNTATGSMSGPAGGPQPVAKSDSTSTEIPETNSLTLAKTASAPADVDDNGRVSRGDTITYTFTVTNSGNQTLSNVTIADPKIGPVTCPAEDLPPLTSAPDNVLTCTKVYALTQTDVDLGGVVNTAEAAAETPLGDPVLSEQATATTTIVPITTISLDKQAGPVVDLDGNGPDAGDMISYAFLVENTGNVSVDDVAVSDPKVGPVTCPSGRLAPGGTRTCGPVTYVLTQADIDSGAFDNLATATASGPTGQPATSSDTTSTSLVGLSRLTTVKTAGAITDVDGNGTDAGDTLGYDFRLTNTGTTSLTVVSVTDPKLGATFLCSPAVLGPGQTSTCSGTYTLTQADIDAGTVSNTATGSALDPDDDPVSSSSGLVETTLTPVSSFTFDKQSGAIALGADNRPTAGDTITYSFVFTNTGGTTLSDPAVTDAKAGPVTCATGPVAPGASVTCTTVYALTQADVDAGAVNNSATAVMTAPAGQTAPASRSDSTSTPVAAANTLTLTKQAGPVATGPDGRVDAGDPITYTFTVTNTGNRTVETVRIDDPRIASTTCLTTTLMPAASTTCTGTYPVTQTDIDAGTVANTATALAEDRLGNPVLSPQASATAGLARVTTASLDKAVSATSDVNSNGVLDAGDTVTYSFALLNIGNTTLDPITVVDPKLGSLTCPAGPLAPGDTLTCSTKTYTVTSQDVLAGAVQNTATATVSGPDGTEFTASDQTSTPTAAKPVARDDVSTGKQGQPQSVDPLTNDSAGDPTVPLVRASLTLLDGAGAPATTVTVAAGVYSVANDRIVFTPNPTFTGTPAPVTYRVTDAKGATASASYQPAVTAVSPAAADDTSTGLQGRPQTALVLDNDTAGDPAVPLVPGSLKLLDAGAPVDALVVPNVGRYDVTNGTIVFTPVPTYTGTPPAVDYRVADENGTTATARLTVTVTPVTPIATNDTVSGGQGQALPINVLGNDSPGNPLVPLDRTSLTLLNGAGDPVTTVTLTGVGRYDVVGDGLVFTPVPSFTGPVPAVTYRVLDVNGTATTATVTTTITPVTPQANDDSSTGSQGRPQTVAATLNDQPGDDAVPLVASTLTLLDGNGDPATTVTVAGGVYSLGAAATITFTPNPRFVGDPAPATYRLADANGTTTTAVYRPSVTPVTRPDTSAGLQGLPQTVNPLANDDRNPAVLLDPDSITLINPSTGQPTLSVMVLNQGTYAVANGEITFTPLPGFSGAATPIVYRATDQTGAFLSDTYTPTVVSLNPGANPDVATGPQGRPLTIDPLANDNPGDPSAPLVPATLRLLDAAGDPTNAVTVSGGVYTLENGQIIFTPAPTFIGSAPPVTYRVADQNGTTATSMFTPTLTAVTPTAIDDSTSGPQGVAQSVNPLTNDSAGVPAVPLVPDTLTLLDAASNPTTSVAVTGGVYTLANGQITFTPTPGFVGSPVAVTYRISDQNGTNATARYRPTFVGVTPQATNDLTSGTQGDPQTVNVLANDEAGTPAVPLVASSVRLRASDGSSATVVPVTGGSYQLGTNGLVTFQPDPGFTGDPAPVTYTVLDANGTSTSAQYQPTVAPVTRPDTSAGLQGVAQSVDPLTNDTLSAVTLLPGTLALRDPATGLPATSVTIPNQGTYTAAGGQITFTPLPAFTGTASPITYLVNDAAGSRLSDSYTPTVISLTPGLVADSTNGPQGVPQSVDPLFNDSAGDPSAPLVPSSLTLLDGGGTAVTTVSVTAGVYSLSGGRITFTPQPGFIGTADPVTYRVADRNGTRATSTYTPTLFAVAPTAVDDTSTGLQGAPQSVDPLLNDTPGAEAVPLAPASLTLLDGAGAPVSTVTVTGGVYTVANGRIVFTPAPGFTGAAPSVRYRVADVNGTTTTARYVPTVTAVTPTARPDSTTDIQGATQSVDPLLNDSAGNPAVPLAPASLTLLDAAGVPATTVSVTGGVYTLANGRISFAPVPTFTGVAPPVSYRVADVNGTASISSYTPTVTAVSPIARTDASTGIQGATQSVDPLLNDGPGNPAVPLVPASLTLLDAAGVPATTVSVTGGVYSIANGRIRFVPAASFAGVAAPVTYRIADQNGTTATSTYTPTVTPLTPTAGNDSSIGAQGATQSVSPLVNDAPGDVDVPLVPGSLTLLDASGDPATTVTVAGGTYSVVGTTLRFVPSPSFTGVAPYATYRVSDQNGTPVTARYTPTVTAVNPIAENDASTGLQGRPQSVDPLVNDTPGGDGTPLVPSTLTLLAADDSAATTVTVPAGVYSVANGRLVFTPNPTFVGVADPVRYQVSDANGTPARASYRPTVTAVTPVAQNDTTTGLQGATQSVNPLGNDSAGDPTVPLVPATLTLLDGDGAPASTVAVTAGVYTLAGGRIIFTPDPTFTGPVPPVTYRVKDQNGTAVTATYRPVITAVDPVASNDTATGIKNRPVSVDPLANDLPGNPAVPLAPGSLTLLDAAGDPASTVAVTGGVYSIAAGRLVFTPDQGYSGSPAPVTYRIADANGTTDTATFSPTLEDVTTVVADDATSGAKGAVQSVDPLANDVFDAAHPSAPATLTLLDAAGNPATTVTVAGGSYTIAAGRLVFTPTATFVGTAPAATYRIADVDGVQYTATYTPTVLAPAPSATNDRSSGKQGQPQSVDPLTNDTPGDSTVPFDASTLTLIDGAGAPTARVEVEGGVYTVDAGRLVFTPEPGFVGVATAAPYRIADTAGRVATATYTPTVTAIRPVAVNDTSTGDLNDPQSVDPLANDTAGDVAVPLDPTTLTLLDSAGRPASTVAVTGGVYTIADGRIVFTPTTGFVGTAPFVRYQVADVNGTLTAARYTPTVADGALVKNLAVTADRGETVTFDPVAGTPGLDPTTVRLVDPASGAQVLQVVVSGEGTWTVDPADGTVTFVPVEGLVGDPTPIDYFGQTTDGVDVRGSLSVDYPGSTTPVDGGGGDGNGNGIGGGGIGSGGSGLTPGTVLVPARMASRSCPAPEPASCSFRWGCWVC